MSFQHLANLHTELDIKGLGEIELVEIFFSYLHKNTKLLSTVESIEELNGIAERYCRRGLRDAGFELEGDEDDEDNDDLDKDQHKDQKQTSTTPNTTTSQCPSPTTNQSKSNTNTSQSTNNRTQHSSSPSLEVSQQPKNETKSEQKKVIKYSFEDIQEMARGQKISQKHIDGVSSDDITHPGSPLNTKHQEDSTTNVQIKESESLNDTTNDSFESYPTIPPTKRAGAVLTPYHSVIAQDQNKVVFEPGYEWSQTFNELSISIPLCDLISSLLSNILGSSAFHDDIDENNIIETVSTRPLFSLVPISMQKVIVWYLHTHFDSPIPHNVDTALSKITQDSFTIRSFGEILFNSCRINLDEPTYLTKDDNICTFYIDLITTQGNKIHLMTQRFNHPIDPESIVTTLELGQNKDQRTFDCYGVDVKVIDQTQLINANTPLTISTSTQLTQIPFLSLLNSIQQCAMSFKPHCDQSMGSIIVEVIKRPKSQNLGKKAHNIANTTNGSNNGSQDIELNSDMPVYWWEKCFESQRIPIDLSKLDLVVENLEDVDRQTQSLIHTTFASMVSNKNQGGDSAKTIYMNNNNKSGIKGDMKNAHFENDFKTNPNPLSNEWESNLTPQQVLERRDQLKRIQENNDQVHFNL